jgi:neutral ceramidase
MEACLLQGNVDAVLSYVDLSQVDVPVNLVRGYKALKPVPLVMVSVSSGERL